MTNFVNFDTDTRIFTVYTTDVAIVGSYTLTVSGTVTNSNQSNPSVSTSFVLTVSNENCATTTETISISAPAGATPDATYTLGSG